jgi:hypothetical protein
VGRLSDNESESDNSSVEESGGDDIQNKAPDKKRRSTRPSGLSALLHVRSHLREGQYGITYIETKALLKLKKDKVSELRAFIIGTSVPDQ